MWKLLSAFIGLLLFGSLSGIVAWSFRILIRVEDYTAIKVSDKAQAQEIISQKYRVQGGWFGFYGVQFFCLSLAKLLVRHRSLSSLPCFVFSAWKSAPSHPIPLSVSQLQVLDHFSDLAIKSAEPSKRLCLAALKRAVCCFVILCNGIGLGAYLFAAFSITRLSSDRLSLAKLIRDKAPADDVSAFGAAIDEEYNAKVALAISIQFCFEAVVLALIIVCYLAVLFFVFRLVRSAKNASSSALVISTQMVAKYRLRVEQVADKQAVFATYLKRRILATVIAVFCALSLSVSSAIIFVIANVGVRYNSSSECGGTFPTGQCWSCQSTGQIIKSWLRFTPEFHAIVVLLGSPATLTFALWGMLSRKDRLVLTNRFGSSAALKEKSGSSDSISH
jgi:hypothetical protein